ncbi:MAG: dihydrolipoamide acetyltransferase family protein [Carnobacterium inhibens]|uniref:dihydrolipoamide acetyltransferase family protein n=1 Tax=Carnobacterium inhibens TaxID=147709 RepID=UPI0033150047
MAHEIFMPKLSSTMTEGSITEWYKEEGDSVEIGEAIFEVMTDKIAIEVESYDDGILLKKYFDVDEPVPINHVIGYIGEKGEKVPDTPPGESGSTVEEPTPSPATKDETDTPKFDQETVRDAVTSDKESSQRQEPLKDTKEPKASESEHTDTSERIRATPAARRLAREHDLLLHEVSGTGRKGRIHIDDVRTYLEEKDLTLESSSVEATTEDVQKPVSPTLQSGETVIPWKGMRKVIADRMTRSKQEIPHVTLNATFDAQEMIKLRQELLPLVEKAVGKRVSYNEIIIKAMTVALKQHPRLNAHALDDGIHEFKEVNVGLAVSVEDGLLVPVIKSANQKGLAELTSVSKELAEKARTGKLASEEMNEGTITLSSLGKSRVESFNPVVNQPEVAILGVGTLKEVLDLNEDGSVFKKPTMTLSLSFDHRAVDGTPAAEFLNTLVEILENPKLLLL